MVIKKILEICCQKSKLTSCARAGNYWLAILPLKVVGYKFALHLKEKKSFDSDSQFPFLTRFYALHCTLMEL